MQSACTVLWYHLWPVRLYHIFQYDLINGTIKKKKFEHQMCFLIFLYKFYPKRFSLQEEFSEILS